MNSLIRLLGQWIARRLESGNARAATIGAVLGVVVGIATAYVLGQRDVLGFWKNAAYVFMPLALGFAGAATGAALPTSKRVVAVDHVRLNNLNRGLIPLFFCCLFTLLAVVLLLLPPNPRAKEPQPMWPFSAGLGVAALISLAIACRAVLWVDVTPRGIRVRRLLGSQTIASNKVLRWGFEVGRGKFLQEPLPPTAGIPFIFSLPRIRIELPSLSAEKVERIRAYLSDVPREGRGVNQAE